MGLMKRRSTGDAGSVPLALVLLLSLGPLGACGGRPSQASDELGATLLSKSCTASAPLGGGQITGTVVVSATVSNTGTATVTQVTLTRGELVRETDGKVVAGLSLAHRPGLQPDLLPGRSFTAEYSGSFSGTSETCATPLKVRARVTSGQLSTAPVQSDSFSCLCTTH
jgi:hypothetical protein